jgi:hypothetical protein
MADATAPPTTVSTPAPASAPAPAPGPDKFIANVDELNTALLVRGGRGAGACVLADGRARRGQATFRAMTSSLDPASNREAAVAQAREKLTVFERSCDSLLRQLVRCGRPAGLGSLGLTRGGSSSRRSS